MKLSREALLAWLVIARYSLDRDDDADTFVVPQAVGNGWIELGWQALDDDGDYVITDAGKAASDLVAPEYGVDPIPAEAD